MQLRRTDGYTLREDGFTLIELIIVVTIIGIIAAIAVPGLLRARMSAEESSAIGSLRSVHSGQTTFSATCGAGHFAPSLDELGKSPLNIAGPGFVTSDLGSSAIVVKSRYTFRMSGTANLEAPEACTGLGEGLATTGYEVTATATEPADRHFALNTTGAVWEHEEPFEDMPEHGAPETGTPVGQ